MKNEHKKDTNKTNNPKSSLLKDETNSLSRKIFAIILVIIAVVNLILMSATIIPPSTFILVLTFVVLITYVYFKKD